MVESNGAVSTAAWPKAGIKQATVRGLLFARKRTLCAYAANVLRRHHAEGSAPTAGENREPGRYVTESLTTNPRVREQSGPEAATA